MPDAHDRSLRFNRRQAASLGATGATALLLGQTAAASATPTASPVAMSPDPNSPFSTVSTPRDEALAAAIAASGVTPEDPAHTGGDVIDLRAGDIATLNPVLRQDGNSWAVTSKIYESLVFADPLSGTFVPQLADSWEVSADGLRWRFHLAPNVTFHDGSPLTVEDVLFSFAASVDDSGLAPNKSTIDAVLASVEKIDDATVELIAKFPSSSFLFQTAVLVPIMPKHIWEPIPFKEWGSAAGSTGQDPKQVIGTGPFSFVEWVQNDHITLKKNESYWYAPWAPVIDQYIYRVGGTLQTFLTGEGDITGLSPSDAISVQKDHPEFSVWAADAPAFWFYMTNLDEAHTTLFTDLRTRQALYHSIDRPLLVDKVLLGFGHVADSYAQVPAAPGYAPDRLETVYTYDVDKAKQLLADAGWAAGSDGVLAKDGTPFSFSVLYDETDPASQQLVTYLQQTWGDLGIKVEASAMPFPSIMEAVNRRDYEMIYTGFGFYAPDGNTGLLFRTDASYPAGYNMAFYSNPEYDRLDDEQLRELDPAKRRELLIDQTNVVNNDAPWGLISYMQTIYGTHPRVHNYIPTGIDTPWTIIKVWVDPTG
ncbi:MAG: ABC transporter substrate-binding protein [Thermomicrobiales bacterium]